MRGVIWLANNNQTRSPKVAPMFTVARPKVCVSPVHAVREQTWHGVRSKLDEIVCKEFILSDSVA